DGASVRPAEPRTCPPGGQRRRTSRRIGSSRAPHPANAPRSLRVASRSFHTYAHRLKPVPPYPDKKGGTDFSLGSGSAARHAWRLHFDTEPPCVSMRTGTIKIA